MAQDMRDDDEGGVSYSWEQNMKRTWDSVKVDSEGYIVTSNPDKERSRRAKLQRLTQSVRRGLIRYMILFLDSSYSARENDFRPSRLEVTKTCLEQFIVDYFDQNPISQLSLALTRDRGAEKVTDLSGNAKSHILALRGIVRTEGMASLQYILLQAMSILKHIPDYGCREILIVYSSLSTCDPGDIFRTIEEVRRMKIRCNIICLSAEIYVCKRLAEVTRGSFAVAKDYLHLRELVAKHTVPAADERSSASQYTDLVYMGFPSRMLDVTPAFAYEGRQVVATSSSYMCPRCHGRVTDIPAQCTICSLQLNSSSHIARSYHHLFPVDNFEEYVPERESHAGDIASCAGCAFAFQRDSMKMICPKCNYIFCVECDIFIHDSLHNCPCCSA